MKKTQNTCPESLWVKVCDEGPDSIGEYRVIMADLGEIRRSAEEIMVWKTHGQKWCCPRDGCDFVARFRMDELDAVPFLIVHHLIKAHGLTSSEVIEAEPSLGQEVRDYCRAMGKEKTPATEQAGVSIKKWIPSGYGIDREECRTQ